MAGSYAKYSGLGAGGGGGSGSVTTVSVVSANGLAGTVANPTTTPAITLSTTVTGIVKGDGTSLSAATAGTDYQAPISLTTTGSSGAATFIGNTLNIPQYAAGTGTVTTVSVVSTNGFGGTVANATTTPAITLTTSVTGLLKGNGTGVSAAVADVDYQSPITLTTTGTSGAATFTGDTLNIPQYAAVGNYITALTDDVVATGPGSVSATIQSNVVSNAKLAQMPTLTLKGNNTGGTANSADLTVAQVNAILPVFTATLNGITPLSGGGTTNFLRADGTWATPAGSVTSVGLTAPSIFTVTGSPVTSSGTLALSYSGTALPIANGGTSQTSANPAFNALSPLTTKGDTITYGTVNQRHAVPGDYGSLIADSGQTDGWRSKAFGENDGNYYKNIIQYADFENNATTGWALGTIGTLTNGLPTGSPTFGSGASGNLSISTVTGGNQITDSFSLQIANSGATTAGNMVHTQAYTVDPSQRAKILNFRLNYSVALQGGLNLSGTSANGLAIAVWDATNSVFIPVTGAFNFIQGSGVGIASGSIQSGYNTASLRFILYFPTASTGSISVIVDDVYLGQQPGVSGLAGSDTKQNNLTLANLGTITNQKDFQYRVGDILHCYGSGTAGTTVASTFSISLPSGLSIDYSKISTNIIGRWYSIDGTASAAYPTINHGDFPLFVDGSTANSIFCAVGISSNALTKAAGSTVAATSGGYSYSFAIPILGWSSNVQQSSDSGNTQVGMFAYLSANQAVTANNPVKYDTKLFDFTNSYNTSTGQFTCGSSGLYEVSATGCSVSGSSGFYVQKNSTKLSYLFTNTSSSPESGTTTVQCLSGDTLQINMDTSLTAAGTTAPYFSSLSIRKVSNPQVIQASEKIYAQYTGNAGTALIANVTNIDFTTKVVDSNGSWNGTTFTASRPGWFNFTGSVTCSSSSTRAMYLWINGSKKFLIGEMIATSLCSFTGGAYLNQQDTVTFRSDSSGTLSNTATDHWIAITSQG